MPAANASRKSFTALVALSDRDASAVFAAGWVVFEAVWDARFRAFCCRPRASPPFFAAALRLLADAPWDLLDDELRDDFPDWPEEELRDAADLLREPDDEPRELEEELRELDPLPDDPDLRAAPPPLLLEELLRVWAM